MDENVGTASYKDFLLKKLSRSVITSIGSQLIILLVYVFLFNFNILHPIEWITSTVTAFRSLRTWIWLIFYFVILFAQCVICGKQYIYRPNYSSTRFQKFISIFTFHNLVVLSLNMITGGYLMYLFLLLSDQLQQKQITSFGSKGCFNQDNIYLLFSGIWNGLYYFSKVHMSVSYLIFPVIHQRKIIQIKSELLPLLKMCFISSIAPTLYFIIIYSFWGHMCFSKLTDFFEIEIGASNMGPQIYLYLWLYGALYNYSVNLRRSFFNLFLTEPVLFPLHKINETSLTLQDSIGMTNLPITQNLASLDLNNLAHWSKSRRQVFFTLSQPGGHPHNWNLLIENVLKILSEYIDILNKSTISTENIKKVLASQETENIHKILSEKLLSPNRFCNLRNMTLISNQSGTDVVEFTQESVPLQNFYKQFFEKCKQKVEDIVSILKAVLGINFLFGELPQANIQRLLENGNVIIWSTQGIAELACASLTEDPYGIVQKDLPVIITTLVNLKCNFDNLNKIPALTRKVVGYDDQNFKMKGAISSAIKRSLFNIYSTFGNCINELPLSKEIITQLQAICKN